MHQNVNLFVKLLGQARPSDTNNATLYTKTGDAVYLDQLFICNNTGSAVAARVFFDDDGTTYDTTTCLFYDLSIAANDTCVQELRAYMNTAAGSIGIRSATGSKQQPGD